jgi:hypothetical protein
VNDYPDDTDTADRLAALEKLGKEWARYKGLIEEYRLRKFDAQAALTESLNNALTIQFLFNNPALNDDPAKLWQTVKDWFLFNTPTILSHLVYDFSNMAMTEKEGIDEFSVRLKTNLSYLHMLGHTESLSSQKEKFMTGIRMHPKQKYQTLALVTQSNSDYEQLSLDELIKKLSSSDVYVNKAPKNASEPAGTTEQANSAAAPSTERRDRGRQDDRGRGRGRGRSQGRGRGAGRGHQRDYGRSAQNRSGQSYRGGGGGRGQSDTRQEERECYRCGKTGHIAKDCRVNLRDKEDNRYSRGGGGGGGGATKRPRQSRDDDEYRDRDDDGGGGGRYRNNRRRERDEVDYVGAYDDGDDCDHVNMTVDAAAVINKRAMYVLDGGCSVSQTHIKSDLINVTPHNRRVEVANGGILRTVARGSRGVVQHISYTPGCKRLLSEKALLKQGYGVVKMDTDTARIVCRNTNKLKGSANCHPSTGLFYIDPMDIQPLDVKVLIDNPQYTTDLANMSNVLNSDAYDHYDNILFMSPSGFRKLYDSRAVKGLKLPRSDLEVKRPLNAAIPLSSMPSTRMRRINDTNKAKPPVGHTIIGDVYGKVRTPGLNNLRYYAFFIDKGGGLSQVYPMTSKDETLSKFKKYMTWKRSMNNDVGKLEYDGGREMINNTSKLWIRDNGIYLCEGAPYKDEHTALINPEIRHTMDLTRAMMIYAKSRALGDRRFLHPWAVTHAMRVRNMTRLVNRNGVLKTRHEWSTGEKPDISKMCYWGCVGYRKIPDIIRGDKQNDKSDVGYFMGYDYDGKSTLVYIPTKRKVINTGDFIFDELAESSDVLKYIKNINDDIGSTNDTTGDNYDLILEELKSGGESGGDSTDVTDASGDDTIDNDASESSSKPKRRKLGDVRSADDMAVDADESSTSDMRRQTRSGGVRTDVSYTKYFRSENTMTDSSDYANMLEASAVHATSTDTYKESVDDDLDKIYDRINSIIQHGIDYVYSTVIMSESHDALLSGPEGQHWKEADEREFTSFRNKQVFELVRKPRGATLRRPKIIHTKKIDDEGNVKYKTRCVIAAYNLKKGVDYNETFSPTVKQDSLKAILVTALQLDLDIHHIDWETAYLNSDIAEDIYLSIPIGYDISAEARKKGFRPGDPDLCLKLRKSLYGTPQAGRNWNRDVHELLIAEGFRSFPKDPCVYIRKNPDGSIIILGLYVDDLLLCSKNDRYMYELKVKLNEKYKLNDLGPVKKFIGMRITRYRDRIEMDLEQYIDKMLDKFSVTDCRVSDVPAVTCVELSQEQCPSTEEERTYMSNIPYRELIGSLLFASTTLVPEISCIVSKLASFMNNPGRAHWHEAKRVLRYLKRIRRNKFIYYKDDSKY